MKSNLKSITVVICLIIGIIGSVVRGLVITFQFLFDWKTYQYLLFIWLFIIMPFTGIQIINATRNK